MEKHGKPFLALNLFLIHLAQIWINRKRLLCTSLCQKIGTKYFYISRQDRIFICVYISHRWRGIWMVFDLFCALLFIYWKYSAVPTFRPYFIYLFYIYSICVLLRFMTWQLAGGPISWTVFWAKIFVQYLNHFRMPRIDLCAQLLLQLNSGSSGLKSENKYLKLHPKINEKIWQSIYSSLAIQIHFRIITLILLYLCNHFVKSLWPLHKYYSLFGYILVWFFFFPISLVYGYAQKKEGL